MKILQVLEDLRDHEYRVISTSKFNQKFSYKVDEKDRDFLESEYDLIIVRKGYIEFVNKNNYIFKLEVITRPTYNEVIEPIELGLLLTTIRLFQELKWSLYLEGDKASATDEGVSILGEHSPHLSKAFKVDEGVEIEFYYQGGKIFANIGSTTLAYEPEIN